MYLMESCLKVVRPAQLSRSSIPSLEAKAPSELLPSEIESWMGPWRAPELTLRENQLFTTESFLSSRASSLLIKPTMLHLQGCTPRNLLDLALEKRGLYTYQRSHCNVMPAACHTVPKNPVQGISECTSVELSIPTCPLKNNNTATKTGRDNWVPFASDLPNTIVTEVSQSASRMLYLFSKGTRSKLIYIATQRQHSAFRTIHREPIRLTHYSRRYWTEVKSTLQRVDEFENRITSFQVEAPLY